MACKIFKAVSFIVCVGYISGQEGKQNIIVTLLNVLPYVMCDVHVVKLAIVMLACNYGIVSVVDVHISEKGVVCWDLPSGKQSSLYSEFRVKVVRTAGRRENYQNIATVSKNCYDLSMLNLTRGEYSVQVRYCMDAIIRWL